MMLKAPLVKRLEKERERPALERERALAVEAREMVSLEKKVLAEVWEREKRRKELLEKEAEPPPMIENTPLPVRVKEPVKVEELPSVLSVPPFEVMV